MRVKKIENQLDILKYSKLINNLIMQKTYTVSEIEESEDLKGIYEGCVSAIYHGMVTGCVVHPNYHFEKQEHRFNLFVTKDFLAVLFKRRKGYKSIFEKQCISYGLDNIKRNFQISLNDILALCLCEAKEYNMLTPKKYREHKMILNLLWNDPDFTIKCLCGYSYKATEVLLQLFRDNRIEIPDEMKNGLRIAKVARTKIQQSGRERETPDSINAHIIQYESNRIGEVVEYMDEKLGKDIAKIFSENINFIVDAGARDIIRGYYLPALKRLDIDND